MDNSTLQDIKDRLNIVDIVGGYIQLKKAGVNFKAACPFHHEKTPSLVISPQKQIWHCFGCGEGGDVFGFVSKYENLDFKETLKILADKAGVQLPAYRADSQQQQDERDLLLRINNFAARYYHEVLMSSGQGKAALEYLKNRGLSEGTIKQWRIGYAPDDFHSLERALAKKQVNSQDLVKAGVSVKNERGQMYDRFRGRITFPIYNYFGEVVGFTARVLDGAASQAKYINSPETAIYNKSKTLFGLNFAKEAIRKKDELVIVEGQMDCISLHQAAFNNVVASSGTAYNEQAADFTAARRLSKNVKLCFDADTAGQTALRKTGEMLLKQGFRVKVVILHNVKDPDELVRKSPGLWDKAVKEAVWFLDYYIRQAAELYPPGSVEQKMYLNDQVIPFLGYISDPLEQDHYIQKIVSGFGVFEKTVRSQIARHQGNGLLKQRNQTGDSVAPGLLLQKEMFGGLLFLPEFAAAVQGQINAEDFEDSELGKLAGAWLLSNGGDSAVKEYTVAKEAVFMVESLLDSMDGDREKLLKQLKKSFTLFKLSSLKRQIARLQAEIAAAEQSGDRARASELSSLVNKLLNLRMELEKNN